MSTPHRSQLHAGGRGDDAGIDGLRLAPGRAPSRALGLGGLGKHLGGGQHSAGRLRGQRWLRDEDSGLAGLEASALGQHGPDHLDVGTLGAPSAAHHQLCGGQTCSHTWADEVYIRSLIGGWYCG